MSQIDWSLGSYERTAAELDPVSAAVVERAVLQPGDRVLDIACGTGNAALKAAARGAHVTGVDLAERLVLVAAQRAQAAGLEARFVTGDAAELPVADDSADVVVSVFGLIFAPDQPRVAAELLRVLAPGGRAYVTAWLPEGALAAVNAAMSAALAAAAREDAESRGEDPAEVADAAAQRSTIVRWGDEASVRALFAGQDVEIAIDRATVPFTAVSPEAWADDQAEHHPLWITARRMLGDDRFRAVQREILDALHEANEDPAAFRVSSRYVTVTLTPR